MKVFFILICYALTGLMGCSSQKAGSDALLTEGIKGIVTEVSGNQMPSPDVPPSPGKKLKTTIYIYEATSTNEVQPAGTSAFYDVIHTKLVATVKSDRHGAYAVELPPGTYSMFTKVDGQYYANLFDGRNLIAPVTVESGKVTEYNIVVNAKATY